MKAKGTLTHDFSKFDFGFVVGFGEVSEHSPG